MEFTQDAITEATVPGKTPIGLVGGGTLVRILIEHEMGVRSVAVRLRRLDPASLRGEG